jgi:ABC-type sugar transport system substrate-binding protein
MKVNRSIRSRVIPALAAIILLAMAACSSGGSSSPGGASSSTAQTSAGGSGVAAKQADAARERVAPYLSIATDLTVTKPLSGRPPKGRKVYVILGNAGEPLQSIPAFKEATQALGWSLTTLTIDPSNPQAASSAMQEAVSGGANYIAIFSVSIDQMGQGLTLAKQHDIPVLELFNSDVPEGAENGVYAAIGGENQPLWNLLPDYIIADSKATAHVLWVTVPDYPIFQAITKIVSQQFSSQCTACTVTDLDISLEQLTGGQVTSEIISTLQSHPDINYILVGFGSLSSGLPEALKAAGLQDKVKIVGNSPDLDSIQSLAEGTSAAYAEFPEPEVAWQAVDAMARLSLGMPIDQQTENATPITIFTTSTAPHPASLWDGPAGYQDKFLKLWGVG